VWKARGSIPPSGAIYNMALERKILEQMAKNLLNSSDYTIKQVLMYLEEGDRLVLKQIINDLKSKKK
jgi:hypothetical protein